MNVEQEINDSEQKIQKLEKELEDLKRSLSKAVGEGDREREIAILNVIAATQTRIAATQNELTELRKIHAAQNQGKNFEFSDVCQISSNLTLIVEFYFNVL